MNKIIIGLGALIGLSGPFIISWIRENSISRSTIITTAVLIFVLFALALISYALKIRKENVETSSKYSVDEKAIYFTKERKIILILLGFIFLPFVYAGGKLLGVYGTPLYSIIFIILSLYIFFINKVSLSFMNKRFIVFKKKKLRLDKITSILFVEYYLESREIYAYLFNYEGKVYLLKNIPKRQHFEFTEYYKNSLKREEELLKMVF